MDVVLFRSGPHAFGIPVAQVAQVFPVVEISPLAGAPGAVRGSVNVHGTLIPVVDLCRRFAQSWSELHLDGRLIFVAGATRELLLLADDVEGVQNISDAAIADMTALARGAGTLRSLGPTGDELIYLYDVEQLLNDG